MYENGKMRSIETFQEWREKIKGDDGRGRFN
jgi:hypothetical protein